MRSAIILTVGATVVAATHPALERLDKRDAQECASVAQDILPELTNIPTPDGSLASFLASQTQVASQTDTCVIPEITGSYAKEYTSYISKLSSWYDDQKEGLSSLIDACSDVPEVKSQIESATKDASTCDKITWAKETGSSSSSSDDKKDGGNAAGVNSVKAGIVVAVAGIAGVFML
ncbi:hypothetical protein FSARC_7596 [Fusarium sarcochroum]|uniref:Infection structure specific protein n=1 Tax=Fusarium sarcochroum TaxID=1208366 RepID=A0A8H4TV28_9HYPO|nr:hypothetical protein FSARC_7596 [Fusarium sarcochroum]